MSGAHVRQRRSAPPARALAAVLLALPLVLAAGARADSAVDADACQAGDGACECRPDGCWDFAFLSSGSHTSLGLTPALTAVSASHDARMDVALLASYRAAVYRARGWLNGHAFARGAIGAGSAGNQGEVAAAIEFGARVPVSRTSGPVLRLGPTGSLFGHDALQLALFQPLHLRAGFQQLVGDMVLEGGATTSVLAFGRFAALDHATSLTGSVELGSYLAVHLDALHFDGRLISLQPSPFRAAVRLGLIELAACVRPRPVALCADLRYVQSRVPLPDALAQRTRTSRTIARAFYAGWTVGLTP